MIELGNYSLAAIFVTSIIVLLIASEVGHAFGWRAAEEANVTTLEAAILGLLALMISFTFSMGLTRFDERRVAVLNESNAIGTAALRDAARSAARVSACMTGQSVRTYAAMSIHALRCRLEPCPHARGSRLARSGLPGWDRRSMA